MKEKRKLQNLTTDETKQVFDSYNVTTEVQKGPCVAVGVCDDGQQIACSGTANESCVTTWKNYPGNTVKPRSLLGVSCGVSSVTCSGTDSGSSSGSGSGANDPVKACEGLNDGAECSWHNGHTEYKGVCKTVGNRTYCANTIKKL